MKVTIAADFRDLLTAHTPEELAQLEANCLADPDHEQMPPIILWGNQNNTIIDGHNQNRIREKHRLKIRYAKLDFDTRDEAMRHALDVQFGRRNSDASQRAMAYTKLDRNEHGGNRKVDDPDQAANLPLEILAEKAGVSERTMRAAANVVDHAAAAIIKSVESGESTVSDAASILELTKAEQVAALTAKRKGKAKTLKAAASLAFDPPPVEEECEKALNKLGATQRQREMLSEYDAESQVALVESVVAGRQTLAQAVEAGEVPEPTAEEIMGGVNHKIESFCRQLVKLFESECPSDHWLDDLGRKKLAAAKLKECCESLRSGKCRCLCPKCSGDGCGECHSTGRVTNLKYQQIV